MMLRHLRWTEAAEKIITAMDRTIADRIVACDFARLMDDAHKVKCSEFANAMIERM